MTERMAVTKATKQGVSALVEHAQAHDVELTRHGHPVAYVVSYDRMRALLALDEIHRRAAEVAHELAKAELGIGKGRNTPPTDSLDLG